MPSARSLMRRMYDEYAESLGLSPHAKYLYGTPLRPVVPLDTASGGVFILGAYPSARFSVINGVADVPVADNLGPFEEERWFDGARLRHQPSAHELRSLFLDPLGISREKCWITDLVKVFLFKPGHYRRYLTLGANAPKGYARHRFYDLGSRSLPWIEHELDAANPQLLITLGAEVAGVLHNESRPAAQSRLLVPRVEDLQVGQITVPTIHCAHPGNLMRSASNPWLLRHRSEFIPAMRMWLK